MELRKSEDRSAQKAEDELVTAQIEWEAQRMYRQWKNCIPIRIGDKMCKVYFPYPNPIPLYNLHDENSAKYLTVCPNQLVLDRFHELKNAEL